METNECWLGMHPNCIDPTWCDCMCHMTFDEDEWFDGEEW